MGYQYVGDEERTFPDLSIVVSPGDVIEAETNPDPRWFVAAKPANIDAKIASDPKE